MALERKDPRIPLLRKLPMKTIQDYFARMGYFIFAKRKDDVIAGVIDMNWTPDIERDIKQLVKEREAELKKRRKVYRERYKRRLLTRVDQGN